MNKNIKVLLLCSKYMPEYSGAGFRAHNLYKRLQSAYPGLDLSVICGSETLNCSEDYEYEAVHVRRIAEKKYPRLSKGFIRHFQVASNFHSEYLSVRKYLKKLEKPDIIHVFGKNYVNASVLDYALRNNIPSIIELVCDMDTPFQFVPFPNRLFVSSVFPKTRKIVCISEKLREVCLSHGMEDKDIWCRPNPVNEKIFHPVSMTEKEELRRRNTKFAAADILISYVAKFRPSKNHIFLIDVLKHLPEEYKLFIKGPMVESGPLFERDKKYFDAVREKIKTYGLESRVMLESGFAENIDELYKMSDVYAFPSTQEGLGTPVLESLACGIPVVAYRIKGVTDTMVHNDENGFLSELDAEEFADKIKRSALLPTLKRREEAEKIIRYAGTEMMDKKYYSIISELAMKGN